MKTYACEECRQPFAPKTGTQRWCDGCRVVTLPCAHCNAPVTLRRATIKDGRGRFCSHSCASAATAESRVRRGSDNNRYNGGLCLRSDGRTVIVCRDGSLLTYYRGVMAAHIGRLLRSDEIVHHINGDPTDDRIENLQITTRAEHIDMHRDDLVRAA